MSAAVLTKTDPVSNDAPAVMTDEQLLLAYRRSEDQVYFEELVNRHREPLIYFLRKRMGDFALAEDAVQATLMLLHVKLDQFEEGRKVRPWLYRIAINQAIDAKRRNRRHEITSLNQTSVGQDGQFCELIELVEGDHPQPATELSRKENKEWLRAAVGGLPVQLRMIVSLVFFKGLKYREAADALAIPVGTLKSRMHAALVELRTKWPELQMQDAA